MLSAHGESSTRRWFWISRKIIVGVGDPDNPSDRKVCFLCAFGTFWTSSRRPLRYYVGWVISINICPLTTKSGCPQTTASIIILILFFCFFFNKNGVIRYTVGNNIHQLIVCFFKVFTNGYRLKKLNFDALSEEFIFTRD